MSNGHRQGPRLTTLKQEVQWDRRGLVIAGDGARAHLLEGTLGQWKSPVSSPQLCHREALGSSLRLTEPRFLSVKWV